MLPRFDLHGAFVDSLDLKCWLIRAGMRYPERVYEAVAERSRLDPPSNPYVCNCVILPGDVAAHLNANDQSPFSLDLDRDGQVYLFHEGQPLTPVSFPPATEYYQQQTQGGHSYGSIAVMEGIGLLAFFYMWPCEYIKTGETCSFCFQVMADMAGFNLPSPAPEDVAEIVAWSIEFGRIREIQLTAGTRFASRTECSRYAELLRAIDARVGLDRLTAEIYCYMTAPRDPALVDQVFEAGADRVGHDLHVWDRSLHARFAPGHARSIGRDGQLRALEYIAERFGPNKAFSAFVVGLEPLDSMLEGVEYLARRGIVPAFSVWMPTPGSTEPDLQPPGLEYYRRARREFARLYTEYGLVPPGIPAGSHVSLCHDIYRHREQLLAD